MKQEPAKKKATLLEELWQSSEMMASGQECLKAFFGQGKGAPA